MSTPPPARRPIPNKLFFRIGEVVEHTGIPVYTLRHWEREFPTLRPRKNEAGQRSYRAEDIEMILKIHRLLMVDGFTTSGARRALAKESGAAKPTKDAPPPPTLHDAPKPVEPASREKRLAAEALALMEKTDAELARLGDPGGES